MRFLAFGVFAALGLRGCGRCGGGVFLRQTPLAVVVQITIEWIQTAFVYQQELVGGGFEQAAVVRHHNQRALKALQGHGEGVAHVQIEVVGRLVEQQQVGLLPHHHRQCESGFFAAGKGFDFLQRHVADKIEAAEEIADVLLFHFGRQLLDVPQRALVGAQSVELVLGEIADVEFVGADNLPCFGF